MTEPVSSILEETTHSYWWKLTPNYNKCHNHIHGGTWSSHCKRNYRHIHLSWIFWKIWLLSRKLESKVVSLTCTTTSLSKPMDSVRRTLPRMWISQLTTDVIEKAENFYSSWHNMWFMFFTYFDGWLSDYLCSYKIDQGWLLTSVHLVWNCHICFLLRSKWTIYVTYASLTSGYFSN